MTLRQALPLHVSLFGMQLLPPNQGRLRFELVQLIPSGLPSASLLTLVTHGNLARPCPKRHVELVESMILGEGYPSSNNHG